MNTKKKCMYLALVLTICFQFNLNAQEIPRDWPVFSPILTPPCSVSDNCNPIENYMPVWRKDALGIFQDCPSPLYVRKDNYTCDKILRIFDQNSGPLNINSPITQYCPLCNIGFVGINAIQPEEQLHVIGNVKCQEGKFIGDISTKNIYSNDVISDPDGLPNSGDEEYGNIIFNSNVEVPNLNTNTITSSTGNVSSLSVGSLVTNSLSNNGNIVINNGFLLIKGTNSNTVGDSEIKLGSNGYIRAREIKVDYDNIPDYVFKPNYKLMPLNELDKFINLNKHLPNIKGESEYSKEEGLNVGELNLKLLEKIEELTLYVIELKKEIDTIKSK